MEWFRAIQRMQSLLHLGEPFGNRRPATALGLAMATGLVCSTGATAAFTAPYSLADFTLTNNPGCGFEIPNGGYVSFDGGLTVLFTGSDSGSGCPTTTSLTIAAASAGTVSFDYTYTLTDIPGFDTGGYLKNDVLTQFAFLDGAHGSISFAVAQGDVFGFQIDSDDMAGTGTLNISNFSVSTGVPEPGTLGMALASLGALGAWRWRSRKKRRSNPIGPNLLNGILGLAILAAAPAFSQSFSGLPVTGIMNKTATVNLTQLSSGLGLRTFGLTAPSNNNEFVPKSMRDADYVQNHISTSAPFSFSLQSQVALAATTQSLPVTNASGILGFTGLTHAEQLATNNGNQFNVEPPNQAIAVGNGFVLEGVNSAVRVYSTSTMLPLLPAVSSNQVFAVAPGINRTTGIHGVNLTDMRVYFDQTMGRFIILQRAQDVLSDGTPLLTSKIYLAISQTGDPTQNYSVYTIDSTDSGGGCPCIADYPQLGSDQFGFYIAANEFVAPNGQTFVGATVLAISKASLVSNVVQPSIVRFKMSNTSTYEASLQPATTAPGSSSFLNNGGLEYFVSTSIQAGAGNVALWAMTNTASLNSVTPTLTLSRILLPTQSYAQPNVSARQKFGPLTLGPVEYGQNIPQFIDGGDQRVQSVTYAGGKLYVCWATQVQDENNFFLSGAAYAVITPAFRSNAITARVDRQGYLQVNNANLLRPYWAVNSAGKGAISFTLVGQNYYPSAAFITADTTTTGSSVQIVQAGAGPEDGFTAYESNAARWGDYNGAVALPDGSIWMVSQFIVPDAQRSYWANWGTYLFKYVP